MHSPDESVPRYSSRQAFQTRIGNAACQRLTLNSPCKTSMRGKAWLRTSPYVALPFDSDRVRPELVGLLCFIPSRAARRGEDFFTLGTEVRRVVLQACGARLLAQSRISGRSP